MNIKNETVLSKEETLDSLSYLTKITKKRNKRYFIISAVFFLIVMLLIADEVTFRRIVYAVCVGIMVVVYGYFTFLVPYFEERNNRKMANQVTYECEFGDDILLFIQLVENMRNIQR